MGEEALLAVDIDAQRRYAQHLYDEGIRGSGWLRARTRVLDYQQSVRDQVAGSLADSDFVIVDLPLGRDTDRARKAPQQQARPRIGKFARTL